MNGPKDPGRALEKTNAAAGRGLVLSLLEAFSSHNTRKTRLEPGLFFGAVAWLMQTLQLLSELICSVKA